MPPVVPAIAAAATAVAATATSAGAAIVAYAAAGGVAKILVQLAAGAALTALSSAMQRRRVGAPRGGVVTNIEFGETAPRTMILGRYASAGRLIFAGSHGKRGDAPNALFNRAFVLSDWPGEVRRWLVNGGWEYTEPEWYPVYGHPVAAFRGSEGREHLYYRTKSGGQTSAFSGWAEVYEDAEFSYGDDWEARGCLIAGETAAYNASVHRTLPKMLAEIDGAPLYDLRKDSSNGGDGPHRWGDQRTWWHTTNPVVMIWNILAGIRCPVTDQIVWGGEIDPDHIDRASFIDAANRCDIEIDSKRKYRAGYALRFDSETTPADVIEDLLEACLGNISEVAGVWFVSVDEPGPAVASFTDDDVIVTADESETPFPGLFDTYNGIQVSWPDSGSGWELREVFLKQRAEYLEADQGRSQIARLTLPAVFSWSQAVRVQRKMLDQDRRFRRAAVVLPPEFLKLTPRDVVKWTSAARGFDSKKFEVREIARLPDGNIGVALWEVNPDDKDEPEIPDTDAPVAWRPPVRPFPVEFTFEADAERDNDSMERKPVIVVGWNPDIYEATGVRVEYWPEDRTDGVAATAGVDFQEGGGDLLGVEVRPDVPLEVRPAVDVSVRKSKSVDAGKMTLRDVIPGQWYSIRARYYSPGKDGPWSDVARVLSGDILLHEADISDAAITNEKVAANAITREGHEQRNDVVDDIQARGTYVDFDTLTISRRSGTKLWTVISESWQNGSNSHKHEWIMLRDGVQVKHWIAEVPTTRGNVTMQHQDGGEVDGVVTYTLQIRIESGMPATFEIDDCDWHVQELSR